MLQVKNSICGDYSDPKINKSNYRHRIVGVEPPSIRQFPFPTHWSNGDNKAYVAVMERSLFSLRRLKN